MVQTLQALVPNLPLNPCAGRIDLMETVLRRQPRTLAHPSPKHRDKLREIVNNVVRAGGLAGKVTGAFTGERC